METRGVEPLTPCLQSAIEYPRFSAQLRVFHQHNDCFQLSQFIAQNCILSTRFRRSRFSETVNTVDLSLYSHDMKWRHFGNEELWGLVGKKLKAGAPIYVLGCRQFRTGILDIVIPSGHPVIVNEGHVSSGRDRWGRPIWIGTERWLKIDP